MRAQKRIRAASSEKEVLKTSSHQADNYGLDEEARDRAAQAERNRMSFRKCHSTACPMCRGRLQAHIPAAGMMSTEKELQTLVFIELQTFVPCKSAS
jgi:hypothetical protein